MKSGFVLLLSCCLRPAFLRIHLIQRGLLFAVFFAAALAGRAQQLDIFIKLTSTNIAPPVLGDSTDSVYPGNDGWFAVSQFNIGATNSSTVGSSSGGAGGGRLGFTEASLNKYVNISSPTLFRAMAMGSHYDTAQLVVRKPGASGGQAFLIFDFKLVSFTSQSFAGSTHEANVNELLQMVYAAFRISVRPTKSDGSLGNPVVGQWNQVSNSDVF